MVIGVLVVAIAALVYAWLLARQILAYDKGTAAMQQIWGDIKAGANAYLTTQLRTIAMLIVVLTVAMFFSVYLVHPTPEALEFYQGDAAQATLMIGLARAGAFFLGASFSALVGYMGMNMAVEGNVRVAAAARVSFHEALTIAYRSGTITGMLTDGLGLLGGTLIFMYFGKASPDVLLGFGFGGTLLALFMRVGGGIFTKAADVGADLVGKVEAGMEEDDPRNAAVVADLVGDNVGDCAGMAADIFESYEVTVVSSLILGLGLVALTGNLHYIIVPLVIRGIGVVSTIIGTYAVSLWKDETNDAEAAMFKSYMLSSIITIVSGLVLSYFFFEGDMRVGVLVAIGVALAVAFNPLTAYATSANSKRVQHVAAATRFGPALVILEGISLGYLSSVWSVLVIVASVATSILIYSLPGLPQGMGASLPLAFAALALMVALYFAVLKRQLLEGLFYAMWVMVAAFFIGGLNPVAPAESFTWVLFGVSLIGVGMLSLTGNNVSMDAFGPIADNANGIGEVAGLEPAARKIMADLDAAGNTTKAITKGVAIGSAVIAALSLYGAFFTDIQKVWPAERGEFQAVINLAQPTVFIGLLLGGMMPLLFGGLLIKAVNRSAAQIMAEVRRQLRIPEIWAGKKRPDYAHAVGISTRAAQAELIPLGVIAVLAPIVVGLLLKEQALGAFLAGIIVSGQLQAVFMANAGGAWDNAKKHVEDGFFGGKGSENHKAAVVGDTVGDPFKDTAGPALNPMIKVMNLVGLIMAPLVVENAGYNLGIVVAIVICILAILYAVSRSDRQVDLTGDEAGTTSLAMAGAGGGTVAASGPKAGGRSPAKKPSGKTPTKKPASRR
jgi:K(+)-stimulated pyrophosphate-energized sodium pump